MTAISSKKVSFAFTTCFFRRRCFLRPTVHSRFPRAMGSGRSGVDSRIALRAGPRSVGTPTGVPGILGARVRRCVRRADLHLSPGDSSIGMNVAYHELMNDSRLMIDPNKDVNEICAFILAGQKNGCVILGGGSPKNFYLQGQPTLWEVAGSQGWQRFLHPNHDRSSGSGGLSGATPAEAVSWGKVNPGVLPDTAVARRFDDWLPLFCGSTSLARRAIGGWKELVHKRDELVAACASRQKKASKPKPSRERRSGMDEPGAEPKAKAESQEPEPSMGTLASELGGYAKRVSGQPRVYVDATCRRASCPSCGRRCTGMCCSCSSMRNCAVPRTASTFDSPDNFAGRSSRRTATTSTIENFPLHESGGVLVIWAPVEKGLMALLKRVDREVLRRDSLLDGAVDPIAEASLPLEGRKLHVHIDWDGETIAP